MFKQHLNENKMATTEWGIQRFPPKIKTKYGWLHLVKFEKRRANTNGKKGGGFLLYDGDPGVDGSFWPVGEIDYVRVEVDYSDKKLFGKECCSWTNSVKVFLSDYGQSEEHLFKWIPIDMIATVVEDCIEAWWASYNKAIPDHKVETISPEVFPEDDEHECCDCFRIFKTKDMINSEMKTYEDPRYVCKECFEKYEIPGLQRKIDELKPKRGKKRKE